VRVVQGVRLAAISTCPTADDDANLRRIQAPFHTRTHTHTRANSREHESDRRERDRDFELERKDAPTPPTRGLLWARLGRWHPRRGQRGQRRGPESDTCPFFSARAFNILRNAEYKRTRGLAAWTDRLVWRRRRGRRSGGAPQSGSYGMGNGVFLKSEFYMFSV
jgi:hypothetical protein